MSPVQWRPMDPYRITQRSISKISSVCRRFFCFLLRKESSSNYFSSYLWLVTCTCNSTREQSVEMVDTIDLPPQLQVLLSTWVLRRPSIVNKQTPLLYQLKNRSVCLISTIYICHIRITTADFALGKRADNSSVIVEINETEHFAVVKELFSIEEQVLVSKCRGYRTSNLSSALPTQIASLSWASSKGHLGTTVSSLQAILLRNMFEYRTQGRRRWLSFAFQNLSESSWVDLGSTVCSFPSSSNKKPTFDVRKC